MPPAEQLRAIVSAAVEAGITALVEGLSAELQPAGVVRMVPLDQIRVDPATYQFRVSTIGRAGTDERLRDCCSFRRELAGVVLLWAEPDGQLALVDGHHRLQLARRSGVDALAALLVDADSPREARIVGALANVAAGNASPADVARLMRDEQMGPEQLAAHGISKRSRLVADAAGLVGLADPLFAQVCTGELAVAEGLALAAAGAHPHQLALAREATRRGWSAEQIREAAQLARLATISTTTADGCLPGFELLLQEADSNLGEVLAIRAAIRRALKGELQALATAARRRSADALEARSVAVVDVAAAAAERDSARALAGVFDRIAGHAGPLADLIRQLATKVSTTRTAGQVVADHLAQVRAAIEQELG